MAAIKSKLKEKIVITAALPYANGNIHIGHLLEYIQADIYARFLRLTGKDVLYICASDMHGTPVEVNAKKAGKEPLKFAEEFWKEHQQDFASFLIKFDNYYKTHSPENKELAEHFFRELKKKKYIYTKKMNTIYCQNCNRYLPDRYVRGTCPNCTAENQYGDVCESCNSTLKGIDLLNPKCSICARTPIQKESLHYFFALRKCSKKLKKWLAHKDMQPEVQHWLKEWLDKGLEDWCISRDEPYFGFEIPDSKKETGEKKFFYVWLDAPIGYISSTKNYCDSHKQKWEEYWLKGKVQHFIGKDISYFHFLFWPAMLMILGIPVPQITVHGFVTVDGKKMSKSRGTFFTAKDFLKMYSAEALRFYYASHLDRKVIDVDLNFQDFKDFTNNVFMGSLGNFCYRVLTFAENNYGAVKKISLEKKLEKKVSTLISSVEKKYRQQDFKAAVREILLIADLGNAYFQQSEAWKNPVAAEDKVGWCVNLARNLAILVQPILPEFSEKIRKALGEKAEKLSWSEQHFKWKGKVGKIAHLVEKVEHLPQTEKFPLRMMIGRIVEVKDHPHAESLYLMKVDLGSDAGVKQVVAGLKKYLTVKELVGKKAVFCVNIKPATLRGEISEAMILAADDGEGAAILEVPKSKEGDEAKFEGMENSSSEIKFEDFLKLTMLVSTEKVTYESRKLRTSQEEVVVKNVKDGAKVR